MTVEELFNKGAHDKAFFELLQSDPEKALTGAGGKPTPQQIESLKHLRYKYLVDVASAFGSAAPNFT
jgi:hypothetical protein